MKFKSIPSVFTGLFSTRESLTEQDFRTNKNALIADGACSMAMVTLQGGPFLAAFALALGATNYDIGLLASIGFLSQFMQLVGLYILRKFPRRRGLVALTAGTARLLWLPIICIPLLFVDRGVTFLMQWLLLSAMIGALAGPAWNSMLRDIVPEKQMGRIFSTRLVVGTALALAFTLGGGYFVDAWKSAFPEYELYAYMILFGVGFLFAMGGTFAVSRLREPVLEIDGGQSIMDLLSQPVRDSNYRRLLIYITVWTFALNLAGPFFIVYLVKRIELSMTLVTTLVVTSQVANLISLRIWGRLADRYSNKPILGVSGFMFLLAILAWTFTTLPDRYWLTLPLLFAIHILSGVAVAGVSLASTNIALKLSPRQQAYSYMTVYGVAAAAAGAVAPMLGGIFADFFSSRTFSLSMNFTQPDSTFSMYALNFKALDFLFFIAFVVGLYSLHRLSKVKEDGEVEEKVIREQLVVEAFATVRVISTVAGLRFLVSAPMSALQKLTRRTSEAPPEEPPAQREADVAPAD